MATPPIQGFDGSEMITSQRRSSEQEVAAVGEHHVHPRIVQHVAVLAGEELRGLGDRRLDLHDVDALDRMPGHRAGGDAAAQPTIRTERGAWCTASAGGRT